MRFIKNAIPFFVFAITLGIGFCFQGTRGLYETSEGRYAECAREMLETGHYLEPQLGYQPHLNKPPLTYWAIMGNLKLLGNNEWAVRLYNAVAFALTVLVVTNLGSVLWNRKCGLIRACRACTLASACAMSSACQRVLINR